MSRKLIVLATAETDLRRIFDWIAEDGRPRSAVRHVAAIRSTFSTLQQFPFMGADRSDKKIGLRTFPARGATVVYLVDDRQVMILGLLGRGRDVDAALDLLE